MCPARITTALLTAVGARSTGGLTALAWKKLCWKRTGPWNFDVHCEPGLWGTQKVVFRSVVKDQQKNYQHKKITESTTERTTIMSNSTTNTDPAFTASIRGTPEKIYRAFLDADAMAKWLPPDGFTGKVHQMDAKVGGAYKMSFTNFTTGKSQIPSAGLMSSWSHTSTFATQTNSMTQTTPEKCNDDNAQKSVLRDGVERCARRRSGRHTGGGGVLPRLAGIARAVGEARRSRDSRLAHPSGWERSKVLFHSLVPDSNRRVSLLAE